MAHFIQKKIVKKRKIVNRGFRIKYPELYFENSHLFFRLTYDMEKTRFNTSNKREGGSAEKY